MIITIDGPVGTGKSTIAKQLADKLGYLFVDTGAMYRCLTYGIIKHKVKELKPFLETFTFEIKVIDNQKHYFYEGEDVSTSIRQDQVTSRVSEVSAIPEVREKLVDLQRTFGRNTSAVFDGRDMGTVVFPNAELKIFLTADPKVRAQRRFDELEKKFPQNHPSYDEVLKSIINRDTRDTTRVHSPLKPAIDAHILDTSNLSISQALNNIYSLTK